MPDVPYTRSGVFASAKELAEVKRVANIPIMKFTGTDLLGEDPIKVVHRLALARGLPEFSGYYGMDLTNGEFVKPEVADA